MAKRAYSATLKPKDAINKVNKSLNEIQKAVDGDVVIKWALPRIEKEIRDRTENGRDLTDSGFQPYSTKYANMKKGGVTSPVTLQDEGILHRAVKAVKGGRLRAKVFIRSSGRPRRDAIGAAHHRGQGVPRRRWFGMSPQNMQTINRDTVLLMEKVVGAKGPGLSTVWRKVGARFFRNRDPWKVKNPN